MRLVLIEGIPGTGKSTMAAQLCAAANQSGIAARWYLEESNDHPVHPHSLAAQRKDADFPAACLRHWSEFARRAKDDGMVHILEGSAFQSTVRFMMEQRHAGIHGYFAEFQKSLAALSPLLMYLKPPQAAQHSRCISAHRGKVWAGKVAAYLEQTPYCVQHGLTGIEGMHRFWSDYAGLCDDLVAATRMPHRVIEVAAGDWQGSLPQALSFLKAVDRRFDAFLETGAACQENLQKGD
jgi:hypothetical protein